MNTMWKLFTGDIKRLTSNVVSIIIVIGLVMIPGLFTWFNVAACWDPFSNMKNLKFAVANVDEGYRSNLIPVKVTVGDQVVNALRANSQLDWTITSKADAVEGVLRRAQRGAALGSLRPGDPGGRELEDEANGHAEQQDDLSAPDGWPDRA